ncbi:hypothetical protein X771_06430 [Mesorhizobium sp. LSJC277A00]|nr:hypothetical protein X771_06430 [Mesorhizobium sp. LSJC277A00]
MANFRYDLEQPTVWRRNRIPMITVRAGLVGDVLPATVVNELKPSVDAFIAKLPPAIPLQPPARSKKAQKAAAVVPLMLFVMATILMIQLQSFQRLFLVVAVAPLGLIGVVAALVPSGAPLGFVAILGVLALIGILIRNSMILIVQIEDLVAEGQDRWEAVSKRPSTACGRSR